jgi:hypothetical protein
MPSQARLGMLEELRDVAASMDGARSITHAHICEAIACISPPDAATAAVFCALMGNIALNAGSAGCTVIQASGAIPVMLDCFRTWPDDKAVTQACTLALHYFQIFLPSSCGAMLTKAILEIPGCQSLLREMEPRFSEYLLDSDTPLSKAAPV